MKGFRCVVFGAMVAQFWLPEVIGQFGNVGQSSMLDRLRRGAQNIFYGGQPTFSGPYGPTYSRSPKLPSLEVGEPASSATAGHQHHHHEEHKGPPHHHHEEHKGPPPYHHHVDHKGPHHHHHHHADHKGPPHSLGWGWPAVPPTKGWGLPPVPPTKAPHHGWGWPAAPPTKGWGWPVVPPTKGWGWPAVPPTKGWGWPAVPPTKGWSWPAVPPTKGWGWPAVPPPKGWGWPALPLAPPPQHGWGWGGKPLSSYYNFPFLQHPDGYISHSKPHYTPIHPESPDASLDPDSKNPGSPLPPDDPNATEHDPDTTQNDPDATRDDADSTPNGPGATPIGPVPRPCPTCACVNVSTRTINAISDIPTGWTVVHTSSNLSVPLNTLNLNPPSIPLDPLLLDLLRQPLPREYSVSWMEASLIEMNGSSSKNQVRIGGRPFSVQKETQGSSRGSLLNPNRKVMPNTIEIVNAVIVSRNNSAPLDGYANGTNSIFTRALNARNDILITRGINNHLETQLRDLSQIFQELDTLERKPTPRSNRTLRELNIGSIFATTSQRFTSPEPDSSEGLILDAHYNFGTPGRLPMEFGGVDIVKDLWEVNLKERQPLDPTSYGRTQEEISIIFRRSIRSLVRSIREAGNPGFIQAEDIAFDSFKQFQFLIVPPTSDLFCEEDVDPAQNPEVIAGNSNSGNGLTPMSDDDLRGIDD